MKKIAIINNYQLSTSRIGGMDRFYWKFQSELKQKNHDIDWYFPNLENRIEEYLDFSIRAWENENAVDFILKQLKTEKYDLIIVHFFELCTWFYRDIKKELPNVKIVVVDHNPRPIGGYSTSIQAKKRIKGFLFSRFIDKFIAVSEYTKSMLINDFGQSIAGKIVVIYNGIQVLESNAQQRVLPEKKKKFVVGCHLRESKGIQDLIEAVNLLDDTKKRQFEVDIYGDGDYRLTLQALVTKYNLDQQFNFKGNHPRLPEVLLNYEYMLQPTHMECFSLGILEALACGVKVITTPVGGNVEVIHEGKNGYLLSARNPKAWAGFLSKLLDNQIIWGNEDFSAEIQFKYSIDSMVKQHLRILEEIV